MKGETTRTDSGMLKVAMRSIRSRKLLARENRALPARHISTQKTTTQVLQR